MPRCSQPSSLRARRSSRRSRAAPWRAVTTMPWPIGPTPKTMTTRGASCGQTRRRRRQPSCACGSNTSKTAPRRELRAGEAPAAEAAARAAADMPAARAADAAAGAGPAEHAARAAWAPSRRHRTTAGSRVVAVALARRGLVGPVLSDRAPQWWPQHHPWPPHGGQPQKERKAVGTGGAPPRRGRGRSGRGGGEGGGAPHGESPKRDAQPSPCVHDIHTLWKRRQLLCPSAHTPLPREAAPMTGLTSGSERRELLGEVQALGRAAHEEWEDPRGSEAWAEPSTRRRRMRWQRPWEFQRQLAAMAALATTTT